MTDNFNDPETLLRNVKSQTWKCFKFPVSCNDIDRSCVHCLEGGHQKRGTAQERAEMELLKGAENVTRDKVEAPKAKRRLPDISNSTQAERVSCGWFAPKQEEAQYV